MTHPAEGVGNVQRSGLACEAMSRDRPLSPLDWHRAPRAQFNLGCEHGLYALFLRRGAELHGIMPGEDGLLYIGLAANSKGLKGRCHFNASTRNHSPRKSLAVLLREALALEPVLVAKPASRNTWSLAPASERRLRAWMHENLEFAIFPCADPEPFETELIGRFAPPLNLAKCVQSVEHRRISAARAAVLSQLEGVHTPVVIGRSISSPPLSKPALAERIQPPVRSIRNNAHLDNAEAIAAHFGLNPKSYRQRLRQDIAWYQKPQVWTFSPGSPQWKDMIAVAERMAGRSL